MNRFTEWLFGSEKERAQIRAALAAISRARAQQPDREPSPGQIAMALTMAELAPRPWWRARTADGSAGPLRDAYGQRVWGKHRWLTQPELDFIYRMIDDRGGAWVLEHGRVLLALARGSRMLPPRGDRIQRRCERMLYLNADASLRQALAGIDPPPTTTQRTVPPPKRPKRVPAKRPPVTPRC
jgi:hypothetical protein